MVITKKLRKNRIDKKRIPYSGHILCSTKSGLFEGELKNHSKYGLFIKTHEDLILKALLEEIPYHLVFELSDKLNRTINSR